MTTTALTTPVTYRPTWAHFWAKAKARLFLIPLAFLIGYNRMGVAALPYLVAALAVMTVGLWIYLQTTTVSISDTAVTRRRWGRTTRVELDDSQRGILCMLNQGAQTLAYLAVRDARGRRIILSEAYWPGGQLLEIAQCAHLTITPADQKLSGKQAARIVPGVVPFLQRRSVLVGILVAVALLVVIVPVVIVLAGTP